MNYDISDRIYCLKKVDNIDANRHYVICGQGDLFMINTNRSNPIKGYGFNIKDCNEKYFYVTLDEVQKYFILSHIMEERIHLRDVNIDNFLN